MNNGARWIFTSLHTWIGSNKFILIPANKSVLIYSLLLNLAFIERSTSNPIFIPSYVRWPVITTMLVFTLLYTIIYFLPTILITWCNDLQIESNEGRMTLRVQKYIINGFKIFLISELMIFFSLIWTFIHLSLVPNIWLWMNFPPYGIVSIFPFGIPLGNVLILLCSSVPLQAVLLWMKRGLKSRMIENLGQLVSSTGLFLWFQLKEYTFAFFTISDSMYGTTFYNATGLHGIHVGFALLGYSIVYFFIVNDKIYKELHLYLKLWGYYWHLVDVVWIALFTMF